MWWTSFHAVHTMGSRYMDVISPEIRLIIGSVASTITSMTTELQNSWCVVPALVGKFLVFSIRRVLFHQTYILRFIITRANLFSVLHRLTLWVWHRYFICLHEHTCFILYIWHRNGLPLDVSENCYDFQGCFIPICSVPSPNWRIQPKQTSSGLYTDR